ncbi:Spermidine N-acetyltransferase protein [Marine Group I thaumarchaeote SCGC AAA799-P11]|uniref:Spermidine N-acetyltransferase protein n=1 Tax=Marine Group I thaumarchaeote SCGC AAA799-P11 TaxID=1502295 RepID=A0A087S307_9ARCH|nr:Spermidine N-acetyltransferase protein [Marine Group I thaumarchaeote SCGC AAA799-P11]
MSSESSLRILHKTSPKIFQEFLLKLEKNTLYNFNPFGKINPSNVSSIVEKELFRKDKIKFFSFCENSLIAYSYLTKFQKKSKKHNCILGIVIGDKWQGEGFGKKICKHMINYAWQKNFEKVWLTVFDNNTSAICLYKSLGFEIEGIFMNDEQYLKKQRHVISMAIFNNKRNYVNKRKKIWQNIE